MNKKQIIAMWIGVAVFVVITFIPKAHVYGIWAGSGSSLQFPLLAHLLDCIVITIAAIYTLRDRKQGGDKK